MSTQILLLTLLLSPLALGSDFSNDRSSSGGSPPGELRSLGLDPGLDLSVLPVEQGIALRGLIDAAEQLQVQRLERTADGQEWLEQEATLEEGDLVLSELAAGRRHQLRVRTRTGSAPWTRWDYVTVDRTGRVLRR